MNAQKNATLQTDTSSSNPITEGVIWKQLLIFFFPILLGTFFQQLYNTVDSVIVGRFVGKEALASVGGSSFQIVTLIVGFFTGLSTGASVTIAHFTGADNREAAQQGLHTAYALAVTGGLVLSAVGLVFTPTFLRLMNTPSEIIHGSTIYLKVYFAGILFTFVYNMGAAILRASGDSKHPFYYLIICCIINITLDILFVPVLRLGVLGVALATLIAQAVSAFLVTRRLMRNDGLLKLTPGKIRFHRQILRKQLKVGLPTGLESILFAVTNIAIQVAMNGFGTDTIAAWSAYGKLDAMFWMVSTAFGVSITTFVGQNYGAGKMDRVYKSTLVCLLMDLAVSVGFVVVLIAARGLLFQIFTSDARVAEIGCNMLVQITPWYITFAFIEVLGGSLRGTGNVIVPVIITLVGVCILRIAWLAAMMRISPTVHAIIYSYPITWVTTAIAFVGYYLYYMKRRRRI